MGFGRGMGMGYPGMPYPQGGAFQVSPAASQIPKEQEINLLKDQAKALQQQLEQIKKRIDELEKEK